MFKDEDDEEEYEEDELEEDVEIDFHRQSFGRRLLGFVFQPRILIVTAALLFLVVFIPNIGRFAPDLSHRREYTVRMNDIRITNPPDWLPADFVQRVFFRSRLPAELPLLDDQTLLKVADAFAEDPWVADITKVEKDFPSTISLQIEYRKPVAMVKIDDGLYPVDKHGILLPPADFSREQALVFPLIANVRSVPVGTAGMLWGDPAVTGAARLAAELVKDDQPGASNWERFDLVEIVAPRPKARNTSLDDLVFELLTTSGSRVVWGRAPGVSHPAELSVAQKIGRLDSYIASYGSFADGQKTYELDIRHWQEISRRQIATQPTGTQRY